MAEDTASTRDADRVPIAVVGMSCRLAGGVASPDDFWRMLADGREAISEVPAERWAEYAEASAANAATLRRTTRWGGFLDDIAGFDAEFFGVLPREAELMDPQQRILLEVAWEALEHAGISPSTLAGGDAGVFVGVGSDDYGRRLLEDLPRIEAWTGIGASMCAVANRISYALDLRGPSFAVDTACSASLVAMHLACQALERGETPLALVGGVNVMAGPGLTVVLDEAGAISPDGRCKSFAAAANGYGRGEGAGVLVLKLLADAERDGDRVLAVVRGSAVHQDGKTNGIMAPSREAQAYLLRRAYDNAGIDPSTVDYVEAHGTGTRMGDPIEAGAMAEVFGAGRADEDPCLIGSVKSNIGHLEAGAGVAGMIKAVLALRHAEIPPSLNFSEPNPEIPWDTAGLKVVTERTEWPLRDRPRLAGVSGYGYGGTIAHVILEEAPPVAPREREKASGPRVFALSGATEAGLRATADRLASHVETARPALDAVAHTLALRRAHLDRRATVVADGHEELVAGLRAIAGGEEPAGVATGRPVPGVADGVVMVFSGHGSQWVGMGRDLLDHEPAFRAVLDEISPVFVEEIGFDPREVLRGDVLDATDVIQPMIFAMQLGLVAVWREHGVEPAAVLGHSVGEIAAAVTAGALDRLDGARLICRRSKLLRRVAGKGAMAMVNLPFDEVESRLEGRADIVVAAIAAATSSTVVAGDADAVGKVSARWEEEGLVVRRVASDVAFHSSHMDPLLPELEAAFADLHTRDAQLPIYSTAMADPRSSVPRDGAYWAANLRQPVRFAQAVRAAADDGRRIFVEVSSHPVVAHSISEVLADAGVDDAVVGSTLRRRSTDRASLLANLGALHCHGVSVTLAPGTGPLAELPGTVWQHKRFWREGSAGARRVAGHDVDTHTLLGGLTTVTGTTPMRLWQSYLDQTCRPYPGDHPVQQVEIIPAAVLLNTFLAAAADSGARTAAGWPVLRDVALRVPVSVAAPRELQLSYQDRALRLGSRLVDEEEAGDQGGWLTHTTSSVDQTPSAPAGLLDAGLLRQRCAERLPENFVIDRLASIGVAAMGFPWQIEELRRGDDELFAVVSAGEDEPGTWASVLDAALSIASVVFSGQPILRMPAAIGRVALSGTSPGRVLLSVRASSEDTVDVQVADLGGEVVAEMGDLRYGRLDGDPGATASPRRLVHELDWRAFDPGEPGYLGTVVVVGGRHELTTAVMAGLAAAGTSHRLVDGLDELNRLRDWLGPDGAVLVVPRQAGEGEALTDAAVRSGLLVADAASTVAGWGGTKPLIWAITAGVRESAAAASLGQSSLWGIGRIIGGEHADIWGGVVDLDPADVAGSAAVLPGLLASRPAEDVIVLRDGVPSRPRLVPVERAPQKSTVDCRPDGTYLVTGGLGVLGLEIARFLAGRGARRIVLAGRRGLPSRQTWDAVTDPATAAQIAAVRALEALGVTVVVAELDVTDRVQAAEALAAATSGLPPIRGVVHAAGVLDNRMLADLDEASLQRVMRPKTEGALVLHELFPPGSLDFLVLFSSCGYLLGLPGQASYGAANAFLDAFAAHRRSSGVDDTVSFGWTSWRGLGMSTSSELIDIELNARGTADITATEALRAWEFAERYDGSHFAVLRMIAPEPGMSRPPLLDEVVVEETAGEAAPDTEWAGLTGDELREYLVTAVRRQVAGEVRLDPDELDVRRPLSEMGLDSVMTLVIRRRLEKLLQLSLPSTLLWTHPTVAGIADFVGGLLTESEEQEMPVAVVVA
ncbi:type I polyketide synthase [Lentzea sp. NPDC092896]|uniref:type I polyketide synthase n=1 Tax=Lentzea sp. NPDC092896 TaxID=3364127 RepID=UPI003805DA2D